jgi:hypothetical protein
MQLERFAVSLTAIAAVAAGAFLYTAHPAQGSDHQDAPAVLAQPGADITDVYMFPSPRVAGFVDFVMNIHPLIPAGMSGSVALDPTVLYNFKAVHGPVGTTAPADSGFQIRANGYGPSQTISLFGKRGTGYVDWSTVGTPLGTFAFNRPGGSQVGDGITAFVGPRADPFFFDLFQFFSILPDRDYAKPRTGDTLGSSTPTFNGFAKGATSGPYAGNYPCSTAASTNALTQINGGFNVISIVLEVPKYVIVQPHQSPVIHLWATAAVATNMRTHGDVVYTQTELLSRPAVKELFEVFAQHATTNVSDPYNDPTLKNAIGYFMTNVAGRSAAISSTVQSVLYPNELIADVSQPGPAAYLGVETGGATGSKFGGRGLTDDVIDTSLGVVFGNTIPALGLTPDDHKENLCLAAEHVSSSQGGAQTQSGFPYLARPH